MKTKYNFLEDVRLKADTIDIVISSQQQQLTQRYLLPNLETYLHMIRFARTSFDEQIKKLYQGKGGNSMYGIMDMKEYPKGFCQPLRNAVFEKIENLPPFVDLQRKGLIFKKVYVTLNDSYFQNGIQLGNLFIDVANDSVEIGGEKVTITPVDKLNYQNFSSYDSKCLSGSCSSGVASFLSKPVFE